ncbi:hypothetical protein CATYP_02415 [Corynebacterium atypicum]|uniref:Phage shock protein PspC N-terminal domain-containing protein n=1 Tax=Corynebacterium atypicum TaxID=191610 RepID=A0ABM5QLU1_9CORY|nr:hypothetical protein CATYP_02415 [Corynebacterium atypicum]
MRYQVDAVLVRVCFCVAAATWGLGVPLYLACWGFMPRFGVPSSPFQALVSAHHDSRLGRERKAGLALLAATAITGAASQAMATSLASTGILIALCAALGLAVFLHQHTPVPPRGLLAADADEQASPDATAADPAARPQVSLDAYQPATEWPDPRGSAGAAKVDWDPLAAAPFDWEKPHDQPAAKKREKTQGAHPRRLVWAALAVLAGIPAVGIAVAAAMTIFVDFSDGGFYFNLGF